MLRITGRRETDRIALSLEGRLRGPWVDALARSWAATRSRRGARPVVVDLTEVTFTDPAGRALLAWMRAHGVRLVATGIESGPMVLDIEREVERRRHPKGAGRGDDDAS